MGVNSRKIDALAYLRTVLFQVFPENLYDVLSRLKDTKNHIDRRRFASTIRPKKTDNLTRVY